MFAAIWNGLISIPVTDVYQNWRHHHFEWGIGLFMIPFVLVGLGLIAWTIHSFLALFNPKVTLKLSPVAPALGDLLDVSWQIQGNASRLRRLRIYLEGREEVQYRDDSTSTNSRSGSNRSMRNSKCTFATFELANLAQAQMMNSGHAQIKIPEDTMPTWKASNNKIVWAIQVEGDIPNWPDIKDEFPVTVCPVSLDQIKVS